MSAGRVRTCLVNGIMRSLPALLKARMALQVENTSASNLRAAVSSMRCCLSFATNRGE